MRLQIDTPDFVSLGRSASVRARTGRHAPKTPRNLASGLVIGSVLAATD